VAAAQPRRRSPRRWGWHPLQPDWADRLVAASPVRPGDVVVDLGAGEGALSLPLARAGCRVLAVELHPRRAAALRERAGDGRVAVLELDLADFRWPGHPFRVVANPPYAGINALVRRLLATRQLRSADLVVAEGGALGLARRYAGRLELGTRLPPHAFRNPPPSAARVLRLRRQVDQSNQRGLAHPPGPERA
jgi:23S rRNA (adenine-N6)-dimethyltransferase